VMTEGTSPSPSRKRHSSNMTFNSVASGRQDWSFPLSDVSRQHNGVYLTQPGSCSIWYISKALVPDSYLTVGAITIYEPGFPLYLPQSRCCSACTYCIILLVTNDCRGRTSAVIDEVRDDVRSN
jgi:hypothetical protein